MIKGKDKFYKIWRYDVQLVLEQRKKNVVHHTSEMSLIAANLSALTMVTYPIQTSHE